MKTACPPAALRTRVLTCALASLLLLGCGGITEQAIPLPLRGLTGSAERDATSIRAIKAEIKKHFERATIDGIFTVKALGIQPAAAWNEFTFEGDLVENDLTTGYFTFRIKGVYDALAKSVELKTRELVSFEPMSPRAPRGASGAQR